METTFPLLSLPEEIILGICWQLGGHHSRYHPKHLSHFCQASKALHRIGTPVLYFCFEACEKLQRLADFGRTVILRPELGALVHELHLDTFYRAKLNSSHTEAFESAASRLGVDLEDWTEHNPFECISQLIIAHTPNVRSIDFMAHEVYAAEGVGALTLLEKMAAQVPRQVSLLHLRRLHVGHDESRSISLGYFGGILELAPSVRELITEPIYGLHFGERNVNDRIPLNNVTCLHLKGGHIPERQLDEIVSRCQTLLSFTYSYFSIYAGLGDACVTPREVIEILRRHNHNDTIRSIYLDLGWRERRLPDGPGLEFTGPCTDGDQILSVKDFSRLENFYFDGSSVLFPEILTPGDRTDILVNMLPSSIRRFQLINTQKEAVANVTSLANSITDFPLLEEVALTGNRAAGPLGDEEVEFDEAEMTMLRKILDDSGVRFRDTWSDADDDDELRLLLDEWGAIREHR